jgi:hypothetical protein
VRLDSFSSFALPEGLSITYSLLKEVQEENVNLVSVLASASSGMWI